MKTPICTFDAKTSVLCTRCETKLRLGQLTHADVDGAIKIAKLAQASQDVNNFTMLGAYKVDDDFILTLGSSDINILRTHPSVLRKFEHGTVVWSYLNLVPSFRSLSIFLLILFAYM